jgi:hypothetical protein
MAEWRRLSEDEDEDEDDNDNDCVRCSTCC